MAKMYILDVAEKENLSNKIHLRHISIDKNTKKAMAESIVENTIPSGIFGDGFIILSPTKIQ